MMVVFSDRVPTTVATGKDQPTFAAVSIRLWRQLTVFATCPFVGRKDPVYEKPIGPPPDLNDFPPPKPASSPMASNPGAAMPPPAPAKKSTPTGDAGSMYGLMDFAADDPDFDNGFPDDGW